MVNPTYISRHIIQLKFKIHFGKIRSVFFHLQVYVIIFRYHQNINFMTSSDIDASKKARTVVRAF